MPEISDKMMLIIKAIVKKRGEKARECVKLLEDVVETYVDDPLVENSARKCLEYLLKQIEDAEKIIREL